MGRIKPKMVKNTTRKLLAADNPFTQDFEENKNLLKKTQAMPSKKIRNKIAGYLARLVKVRNKPKKVKVETPEYDLDEQPAE